MESTQPKSCKTCGKEIIDTGNGFVHAGGGTVEQRCNHCGWTGGQVGKYNMCPRCSDATQLVDDHNAS